MYFSHDYKDEWNPIGICSVEVSNEWLSTFHLLHDDSFHHQRMNKSTIPTRPYNVLETEQFFTSLFTVFFAISSSVMLAKL